MQTDNGQRGAERQPEMDRFPLLDRLSADVASILLRESSQIVGHQDCFGKLTAAVGVLGVARLVDVFRSEMASGLDVTFGRILGIELRAQKLCRADALGRVDIPLQRNDAGGCDAKAANAPVNDVAIAAVEADDMSALMVLEEIRDARGRRLASSLARISR